MKKRIVLYVLVVFAILSCNRIKENPDITENELLSHVEFLASDSLKGRYPGTQEDFVAASYIAAEFRKAGLSWFTENGLQEFEVISHLEMGKNNTFQLEDFTGVPGKDFVPAPFSSNKSLDGEVIFCGYGFEIDNNELKWNDYSGLDVSGKWVMVLRGDPLPDQSMSVYSSYSNDRDKGMVAIDNGASGIIYVSGPIFDPYDELLSLKSKESPVGIPAIHISRNLADMILKSTGNTIENLEKNINKKLNPVSFNTGINVKGSSEIIPHKVHTFNVVGYIEGSHPMKKNHWIILGAHYDHLGMGGQATSTRRPDTISVHYGADDNASGVATLIEIAEKIALSETKPDRSFMFLAFGAEEMGLVGSKYFVDSSMVPLNQVSLMMNLDMVGRMNNHQLQVIGTGTSDKSEEIVKSFALKDSITLMTNPEGFGASDQSSFYNKDIPVLFLTTGVHTDYHTPADRPDKINYSGMVRVADYAYQILDSISRLDSMLTFQEAGPKTMNTTRLRRGKITLGIMPDVTSMDDSAGMRVEFVTPGKPADLGGMKKGDMILAIEGKPVNNVYDYMFRLQKLNRGQMVIVTVDRNGTKLDLLIQL